MSTEATATKRPADAGTEATEEKRLHLAQSSLETLPKELMWKVMECVPEAVLALRTASSSIKSHVDDFALAQSTIPVVEKISFCDMRLPNSERKAGALDITIDVPSKKQHLFFLRLSLRKQQNFMEEIKKMMCDPAQETNYGPGKTFDLKFDSDVDETAAQLEYLRECMSRRIGYVQLFNCTGDKRLADISKMLEGKTFYKMKIVADEMPEEVVNHMLKSIVLHNVREVVLSGKFNTTVDTASFLRQLSSHIRALQIFQTPNENPDGRMFGKTDTDYASLIVDLFGGSIDKLGISNPTYPNYLTFSGTNKIIDSLKTLGLGKKIWFAATCDQFPEGFESTDKEYHVKVNAPPPAPAANAQAQAGGNQPPKHKQFLQIMHDTRVGEKSLDTTTLDLEEKENERN